MITQARITADLTAAGFDWITALRAPAIKALREAGALQMSLFDERDMASITSPDFPGERLILCRNRALAAERARKREDLLAATERDLTRIAAAGAPQAPARCAAPTRSASKSAPYSTSTRWPSTSPSTSPTTRFDFARKTEEIAAEAGLDGIYVVRTSLPATALDDAQHRA